MASDATTDTDAWTWAAMEPEPTAQERNLYDLFAQEYLRDNNATLAASRCGFQAGFADEYGKRLITKSYVQKRIAALRMHKADSREDKEFDHSLAITNLRTIAADPYQKGSARVAAIRQLSAIRGFNAPTKSQVELNGGSRGGVVLLPGIASLDDWEAAATASQQALAEASRVS